MDSLDKNLKVLNEQKTNYFIGGIKNVPYINNVKKGVFILLGSVLCFSCAPEVTPLEIINLETAISNKKNIDFNTLSKEQSFTKLECTGKENAVGEIYLVKEDKEAYYVCSENTIKSFDKNGKYNRTYGVQGRGPQEYAGYIGDFDLHNSEVLMEATRNIVCYDANGNFKSKDSSAFAQFTVLNDKILGMIPTSDKIAGTNRTIARLYDMNMRVVDSICLPGKNKDIPGDVKQFIDFQVFSNDGFSGVYIKEELEDTLFTISYKLVVSPAYILNLGRYKFPIEMYNFDKMDDWNKYYRITSLSNSDNYLMLTLQNGLMGKLQYVLYDKQTKESFTPTNKNGENGFFINEVKFTPLYIHNNQLIGYINPHNILSKENFLNEKLKILKDQLTEESNPVIISLSI